MKKSVRQKAAGVILSEVEGRQKAEEQKLRRAEEQKGRRTEVEKGRRAEVEKGRRAEEQKAGGSCQHSSLRIQIPPVRNKGMVVSHIFMVAICGLMLFLTGCPPELPPIIKPWEMTEITAEEVSTLITQRSQQFQNLRGLGKVIINTWDEKYKFSEVFVLETPESFRLETLGFLDQPVVFLTSDGGILSLYSKKHNKYYTGVASQENLFKLSGINLSVEDVIQVLSGNPPLLLQINSEWGMFLSDIQRYYLERTSLKDNIIQRIWFDTNLRVITNIEEYRLTNGKLFLDIEFKDYRAEEGSSPVPAFIRIDRPLDKTKVEIKYTSFEVNQQLDQTVFDFPPPEHTKKIHYLDDVTTDQIEQLAPYEEFRVKE